MFHKAVDVHFLRGTSLEVIFQDGKNKRYDMSNLFNKYPQLQALKNRSLFLTGKLVGGYGIIWNDDLDLEVETIYEDGITVRESQSITHHAAASAVAAARSQCGISQSQLASLCGIDQSDISKIERGIANPSVATLEKIAKSLGGQLTIEIKVP